MNIEVKNSVTPVDYNTAIDLLEKRIVDKIIKKFSKNKKSEIITLSTFNKDSISKIKAKLLYYVS